MNHWSEWPKWVKTTGLVPMDVEAQELYEGLAQVKEQVEQKVVGANTTTASLSSLVRNEEGQVVAFTDGGCSDPTQRILRRAGFGIFFGEGHEWNRSIPLGGTDHSAARAELRAALWALEWTGEPVEITSDNESVVKGVYQILFSDSTPKGTHEDLWARMEEAIKAAGKGNVSIRWTKGHAEQQHIDAGVSTPFDKAGNDGADALATKAVDAIRVPEHVSQHYHTRRLVAIATQRMMVECAMARKEEMVRLKHDRRLRLALSSMIEEGREALAAPAREPEDTGTDITGARSLMMQAYPGAQWQQGRTRGYYNELPCVFEPMTKRQWGRDDVPFSMMEPTLWYWARLGIVEIIDRTQCKGTTWIELYLDFMFETGYEVGRASEKQTNLRQDARSFSIASARVLKHMRCYGRTARQSQGITSLVTGGA